MERARSWAEIGSRVAEARLAAGLSQEELASRVGLERTALVRIEAGDRRITALELFGLAEALGVPLGHLVSMPPPALVARRTALDERAGDATRTRYRLDVQLQEHARNAEWLIEGGFLAPPALDATLRRGLQADPTAFALAARRAADAVSGPLGRLADVLERFGLYLTVVDEAAEGASLLLDGFGVAVISSRLDPGRRRWTAVHELGHHLMQDAYHNDAGVAASRDERERLIDRFVGEFLLPSADVRRRWEADDGTKEPHPALLRMSAEYRLSWGAVVTRAAELGLLTPAAAQRQRARTPVLGDFLSINCQPPTPDLELGATGGQWRQAVLTAWQSSAVTRPRAVELLYGAIDETDLPDRDGDECLP